MDNLRIYLSLLLPLLFIFSAGCVYPSDNNLSSSNDSSTISEEISTEHFEDNIIPVTTGKVRLLGRTYQKDEAIFFNWTASGFEFTFEGTKVIAKFLTDPTEKPERWPWIYVFLNGDNDPKNARIIIIRPDQSDYVLAENLPHGVHSVKIFKRTGNIIGGNIYEDPSLASRAGIVSLNIPGGKLLNPPTAPERRLEFIGDSITVGAGVLGEGNQSIYLDRETEDGYQTYAAFTARILNADFQVQAISGMGLISSVFGGPFIQLPDEFPYTDRYSMSKLKWDHSSYVPHVVIINLGTNDTAGVGEGKKFTEIDFEDAYYDFLLLIRETYPGVKVVGMLGAMSHNRMNLFPSIERAVNRANADIGENFAWSLEVFEDRLEHGVGGGNHPTVKASMDHANVLSSLISEITGWEIIS